MSQPEASTPSTTTSSVARAPRSDRSEPRSDRGKPRVSLAIATAFGLGYLPSAPGTFGSLAGMILAMSPLWFMTLVPLVASALGGIGITNVSIGSLTLDGFIFCQCLLTVGVALIGVWTADRASKYWGSKDPQKVVIDEVSGQHLALLLGGFWPRIAPPASVLSDGHTILWSSHPLGLSMVMSPNWKYLLLGFILFRVFDIWKPFPARQAESLPGGLGIMADDWIAGIYAALGLWIARAVGL
jgi:phosphatidylglycerophosphatase A